MSTETIHNVESSESKNLDVSWSHLEELENKKDVLYIISSFYYDLIGLVENHDLFKETLDKLCPEWYEICKSSGIAEISCKSTTDYLNYIIARIKGASKFNFDCKIYDSDIDD